MTPQPQTSRRCAPRAEVELPVTLARSRGNPIASRTVDLGPGGMRVCAGRPLVVDELLVFDLVCAEGAVAGRARVLREHVGSVYALRFEGLAPHASEALGRLASG